MEVMELLTQAVEQNAADIFLVPGMPFSYKIGGRIICQGEEKIMPDQLDQMITRIYEIAKNRSMERVLSHGDDDFSFAIPGVSRFRANVFRQRGSLAAVIRVVRFELPDPGQLKLPDVIMGISKLTRGMVLVTGSAGSGKSTTLACIIDEINKTRNAHVITLEDPIEYLHRHKKSVVTQREVATDTDSYVSGLRASLRQAPDVILLGEMRDHETISIAMTAAETGHPDTGESSTEELTALIFERAVERYKTLEVRDEDIRSEEMKETLAGREEITEFDEELYRKLIKQILVYKDNSVKVIFHNNNSIKIGYGEE